MKIGMVAGEASGSILGSGLIHALKIQHPDLQVSGIGGADMISAGFHSFHEMERLAVMGLIEPLGRLPELFAIRRHLYQHFSSQKPDLFIGIDAPDFKVFLPCITSVPRSGRGAKGGFTKLLKLWIWC
jgi:lipid-A-disaccharide synthase